MSDGLVNADVIAELLDVPASWVREAARANAIPHYRIGRYRRFRVSEVLDWLAECRNAGRPVTFRKYHPAAKTNAPAPRKRSGADTEGSAFDAPES